MNAAPLPQYLLPRHQITKAASLQRKGMTIREIADVLDVSREAIEQYLYWNVVAK